MSWLPKRDKLDPVQASAMDLAVAQEGNFYIKGAAARGNASDRRSSAFSQLKHSQFNHQV